jgi:hypothetical protein
MDILNFISWLKSGKYSSTVPINSVTVVGVPNPTRGDAYLPVTVPVSAFGGGSNIGKQIGGGIVVAEWDDNGVKKALVASLTNLSNGIPWTIPAFQTTIIGGTAQSYTEGSTNTDAIIAQAGGATTAYAAGIARLYLGGSYNDWYLPSNWELSMCYQSASIVNKVLGLINGFSYSYYWSSTESSNNLAISQYFPNNNNLTTNKINPFPVRAVRIHTL